MVDAAAAFDSAKAFLAAHGISPRRLIGIIGLIVMLIKTIVEHFHKKKVTTHLPEDIKFEKVIGDIDTLYSDKPLVLEIFATWCRPCQNCAPKVSESAERFPAVDVVALTSESAESIREFAARLGFEPRYTLGHTDKGTVRALLGAFGERGYPTALLFDAHRELVWKGNPAAPAFATALASLAAQ